MGPLETFLEPISTSTLLVTQLAKLACTKKNKDNVGIDKFSGPCCVTQQPWILDLLSSAAWICTVLLAVIVSKTHSASISLYALRLNFVAYEITDEETDVSWDIFMILNKIQGYELGLGAGLDYKKRFGPIMSNF